MVSSIQSNSTTFHPQNSPHSPQAVYNQSGRSTLSSHAEGGGCLSFFLAPFKWLLNCISSLFCCFYKSPKIPHFSVEQLQEFFQGKVDITKQTDTSFTVTTRGVTLTLSFVPYGESFAVQIEGGRDLWKRGFSALLFQGSSAEILKGVEKPSHISRIEELGFQKEGDVFVKKASHQGVVSRKQVIPGWTGNSDHYVVALPRSDGRVEIVKLIEARSCNYLWVVEECPENGSLLAAWAKESLGHQRSPELLVVKTDPLSAQELTEAGFYCLEGTTCALAIPDQQNEADLTLFHYRVEEGKYLLAFAEIGHAFYSSCTLDADEEEWMIEGLEPSRAAIEQLMRWIQTRYLFDVHFSVEAGEGTPLAEALMRQGFIQTRSGRYTYIVTSESGASSLASSVYSTPGTAESTPRRNWFTPEGQRTPAGRFFKGIPVARELFFT